MAEPKKKTDKVVPPEPVVTTPDPTQDPPAPTYEPPEKYQGKSIEEVISMHQEAEKRIGSQGDELGKERKERERAQNDLNYVSELYQTQQAKTQTKTEEPEIPFDFDQPGQSMDKRIDTKLKAFEERQRKVQQQQRQFEATQSFLKGKSSSLKTNPELYDGIEDKVGTAVWNAYLAGMIPLWDLGESKTWQNAARLIHMNNESWDRVVPPKINPVSPTGTETPDGMQPPSTSLPGEPLAFDAHGEEMLALAVKGGAKKDEFVKKVQERRKQFGPSRGGE
ncbi:MAG: hypothetical protein V3V81_08190 [Candidatus Bathyarchaeia archaeon]